MSKSEMGPRRADALASIDRIRTAAREAFAEGGGSTSLELIAQRAGIGIATLYRHFPNKEAVARAVFDQVFAEEVAPLLQSLGQQANSGDSVLEVVMKLAEIADRDGGLVATFENPTEVVSNLFEQRLDDIRPILTAAQEAGELRADLVVEDLPIFAALVGMNISAISDNSVRQRYLSILLRGLRPPHAGCLPVNPT